MQGAIHVLGPIFLQVGFQNTTIDLVEMEIQSRFLGDFENKLLKIGSYTQGQKSFPTPYFNLNYPNSL